ncbi:lysophospholipid acyltransferase family protein [Rarobacter incanus]|uniref:1-acyl-sn-glycerol-3-phosphate acyltransferase n=1 Tax=Rarobacter incanus TaxID=153494 RepID=A0A542SMK4_9MICO|nr:lysophospholipid acyltransferase family protein [Rarobacter incanus]TQK75798.1 1-acyl-sn-glycerol-3-phosphate acyltransferase [Rarobacter incanus]
MKRVIGGPLLKLAFRPWVIGAENVPESGPVIMASNHLSVLDSFLLPLVLDRNIVFIGKAEYFAGRGITGRITAGFMRGVGTIPVDRSGGRASEAALRTGLNYLKTGGIFGIYPEGTRSPDGKLYRGKTGVARLAIESGAKVVPVAMIGTNVAQPIGRRLPRPMRIGIVFGKPLSFEEFRGTHEDRFVLRQVTDDIMYAIQQVSGQEYVDAYAATVKAQLEAGKDVSAIYAEKSDTSPGDRPVPADLSVPEPPK